MRVLVFDDDPGDLAPLTDYRSLATVRTGAWTTLERFERALGPVELLGDAGGCSALERERGARVVDPGSGDVGACLVVSSRLVLPVPELAALPEGAALFDGTSGRPLAARLGALDPGRPPAFDGLERRDLEDGPVIREPWDVVRHRTAALGADLDALATAAPDSSDHGAEVAGDGPVRIAPSARVWPGVVIDATGGPVVVSPDAVVRPRATLCGPCFVGPGSTVLDGAVIRPGTAIGPVCKVNGEVGGTIFQGHANKAHDGYLGDSYVGEWVNLGAGTITSNLLNTYGEIRSHRRPDDERRPTGLTFFGSLLGDHTKTAIGTRLMTGSVFGSGTMLALSGLPPTATRRFAWLTDAGERVYDAEKFLGVALTVMGRRSVELTEAYAARVRALHAGAGA